jgi:hypothetical protein
MNFGSKLAICAAAGLMVSGCTAEQFQSFTIGAATALVLVSATQGSDHSGDDGAVECDPGYRTEIGYDEYDRLVYFCIPVEEYYSQDELDELARQPR